MGFLKQMKDMKATVAAAPSLIQQGQDLAVNAQAMQTAYAAQMAQAAQYQAAAAQSLPDSALDPIHGVDLSTYAWVSKRVADGGYDQSLAVGAAAQRGLTADQWQAGAEGWAARMQSVPGLGAEFRRRFDAA